MQTANQDVLDLAYRWVCEGHNRDQDYVTSHGVQPTGASFHTVASGPGGAYSLEEFAGHLRGVVPCPVLEGDSAGFEHDDMATVFGQIKVDVHRDGILDLRYTVVLLRLDDEWKVVHCHLSEGVPHQP